MAIEKKEYDAVEEIKSLGADFAKKYSGLQEQISQLQKQVQLGAAYPQSKTEDVDPEVKDMIINMRNLVPGSIKADAPNSVGTQASMGYLAAPTYQQGVIRQMYDSSPILGETNRISIAGNVTNIAVESEAPTAAFVTEIAERPEVQPVLGMKNLALKEAGVDVALSNALLRDANLVGVESYIQSTVSDSFARLMGNVILNGDGTTQPQGILTSSDLVTEEAAVGTDALFTLEGALPDDAEPNAKFFMRKSTFLEFVKAFGTSSNYITMPLDAAHRPMIHGHEVVYCADMPDSSTAGNIDVLYGDMRRAYTTGTNGSMLYTLVDPYSKAHYGQTVYHFSANLGGVLVQPKAIVGLKVPSA